MFDKAQQVNSMETEGNALVVLPPPCFPLSTFVERGTKGVRSQIQS